MGGDIVKMSQLCPVPIPGYRAVMLTVQGLGGSVARIHFDGNDITVNNAALVLQALDASPQVSMTAPTPLPRPMMSILFPTILMTTGEITVQGQKIRGKTDAATMTAELVFATSVPFTGNPELDKAVAGKTVVGRFHVALTK
jgi:hypothetical protein